MTEDRRRLIVLRHGETTHNANGVWQGHLDSPLSARGEAQAVAVGLALKTFEPVRVVASDLSRAQRTGAAVAEACGVGLDVDDRLREIHAGGWQGLTGAEVRARYPEDMDRMLRGEDFRRGGEGESVADVVERCRAAVGEVVEALGTGECAVLATHGVSARALVADLVGIPQQTAWLALGGLGNCRWAEVVEGRAGWRIRTWNAAAAGAPGAASDLA